jgi:PTH1 family peptidyl-tRNA hydrolase
MNKEEKYLVVGIGNPGKRYDTTRHNVGQAALDNIYKLLKKDYALNSWQLKTKLKSSTVQGKLPGIRIILAKPKTYMNQSGQALLELSRYYKIPSEKIIILHDEIDLPLGKFKINFDRGSAGHKGITSIIKLLKTKRFTRIRIGIQPKNTKNKIVEKFVLGKFTKPEKEILKEILPEVTLALQLIIEENLDKAMAFYN